VVGASGLLVTNFHQYPESLGDWEVITLSRKPVGASSAARHLALDVLDRNACTQAVPALAAVTHVFYLSRVVEPDYVIKVDPNVDMLKNLIDHLDPVRCSWTFSRSIAGCRFSPEPEAADEAMITDKFDGARAPPCRTGAEPFSCR
jgi:hypothetical protein